MNSSNCYSRTVSLYIYISYYFYATVQVLQLWCIGNNNITLFTNKIYIQTIMYEDTIVIKINIFYRYVLHA